METIENLGINNLKIMQNKDYFCFGTDSVLLANFAKSISAKNTVVDLCSGSGVIPIIFSAKNKYKKIYAIELQKEMYHILSKNININSLENEIITINKNIKDINLTNIDIVICNPPYKQKGTGINCNNLIKDIARFEIECNLEDIFKVSSKILKSKGELYLVHKPERLADLCTLSRKYNLEPKDIRYVYPTLNKKPSIILIKYVKDGGNEINHYEALIEYDENGKYTEGMNDFIGGNNG